EIPRSIRAGDEGLHSREEVTVMGGPWKERGFDAASLPSPVPRIAQRVETLSRGREQDGLAKIILLYIAAVIVSFGVMLSLLQQGWWGAARGVSWPRGGGARWVAPAGWPLSGDRTSTYRVWRRRSGLSVPPLP